MKIFGSSKGKRIAGKSNRVQEIPAEKTAQEKAEIEEEIQKYQKYKKKKRIIIFSIIVLIIVGLAAAYALFVKPPDISDSDRGSKNQPDTSPEITASAKPEKDIGKKDDKNPEATPSADTQQEEDVNKRKEGVYTFLIVGQDNGFGNTDTIMVGRIDTNDKNVDIVSIPRDTLVNVEWSIKKINTLYLNLGGIEGMIDGLQDILGFEIDSYVVVDLNAFVKLIDTIDGVDFDVPVNMNYDDPLQNLHIHIDKGYQWLSGENALKVVRFRQNNDGSGYPGADIDRIATQQRFLKTVFAKCLSLKNIATNLKDYAEIFEEYVDTDLTVGNMMWYAQQLLTMDSDAINFHTLPEKYNDSVRGLSYCSIYLDEWLEMLNSCLNPMTMDIKEENLNILTRDGNGDLYATIGTIAGGYDSFYRVN